MLDANAEIDRLRQRLRFKNLSEKAIDSICDDVSREISITASDMLAEAMQKAVEAGQDARSEDFVNEIRAVRSGSSFDVITDSGRTDFSEPPFPMLPKLLKNAKTAKDGSLYKVIPIKNRSNGSTDRRLAVTTEAALAGINKARYLAKEEKDARRDMQRNSSPDALRGMDTFASNMSTRSMNKSNHIMKKHSIDPVINFRTASSKQDASSKWVQPGRNIDMGNTLRDINLELHTSIDRVIEDTIRRIEGMF